MHVVCSDGFAGVERYIATTARGLCEQGLRVTVIGGAAGDMRRQLDGLDVTVLPGDSIIQAWRSLRGVDRPDVVNTHMTEADLVGAVYRRRARRVAHISTRHFGAPRGSSLPSRAAAGFVRRGLRAQIAISRFVARSIDGASDVVHTGVENSAMPPRREREPVALVAQRLEPEKHTALAVRAWAASGAAATGWRLDIAGAGSQRRSLEQLSAELNVTDSVRFLGLCTDLDQRMARAGVLIAPTPREGLGLSVLEAMAHALPVVAARSGGHLETVGAVPGAALFEPDDAVAAALQINRLISDPGLRDAYGAQLQQAQREQFSIAAQIDRTIAIYRRVVE
ncbi:hypothetical protein GCM10022240_00200 [Microbacterium kribbense]|uniref:D-inositol 3-phosphate glycosyltransferase n=1 Tax=Microbacterium kribbense TaxID=433645 RepID=A0ABP7FY86_9MICO